MREKLCEYLKIHGVSESLADEMQNAYFLNGFVGVRSLGLPGEFDSDEMEEMVKKWQNEQNEQNEHEKLLVDLINNPHSREQLAKHMVTKKNWKTCQEMPLSPKELQSQNTIRFAKYRVNNIKEVKCKDKEMKEEYINVVLQRNLYDLFHHITSFATGSLLSSDVELLYNIKKLRSLLDTDYYEGKLDNFFLLIVDWMQKMLDTEKK